MLIVGERINATRKRIRRAVEGRDVEFIRQEARKQAEAGADYIDLNAGSDPSKEADNLAWLAETVQEAVELPLCLDSASPEALKRALSGCERPGMINSITAEKERLEGVLPLVVESGAHVVALTMDDTGMPEDTDGRVDIARALLEKLNEVGVEADRVHFDPLIRPVSTDASQPLAAARAVRRIMDELPGVHTICGLSNVSFGLPRRRILNRAYLVIMIASGLDGAIVDPTETGMYATLCAAQALLGRDEYCMNYIAAERAGRLED